MNELFDIIKTNTLKRDLTIRLSLLLSVFIVLLSVSYYMSSRSISDKEFDSILLNIAGRQRMLIYRYVSEINQVLVGLSSGNLDMVLAEKKQADRTAKRFEDAHDAFVNGGKIIMHMHEESAGEKHQEPTQHIHHLGTIEESKSGVIIPAIPDHIILNSLKIVNKEWFELKRIALLSLRSNANEVAKNRYVLRLLDQASRTSFEMDYAVQQMQISSEEKLRKLDTIHFVILVMGMAIFIIIIYFVYNRIVRPLDRSVKALYSTTENLEKEKLVAEKANRAKSEFLSSMSHELRTPLNAILGFSQLMELSNELSDDTKDSVKEIRKAGGHLLELINEVLDLAKIEAGRIDLSIEPIEYKSLIDECLKLMKPIADHHNITIDHMAFKRDIIIRGDRTRIKQIVMNLLSNAIKYNQVEGRVDITVKSVSSDTFRISVIDNGIGIKKEAIKGMFEAFNRLGAEESDVEGTGIGLVITKRLVELMGGCIGVDSEYGVGSTFWIELPGAFADSSVVNGNNPEENNLFINDANNLSSVLYIEDNPVNLKLISKLFSHKNNVHLLTAHTPFLGLELAKTKLPDLILLDIQMPEMNGFQVLESLKLDSDTKNIPVVAVSASALKADIKKAEIAGFDDYLTKPLDIPLFYETIERYLLRLE